MTLEFRPPFQIDPNAPTRGDRSLASLNQTFSGISQQALQYSQQQKDNKMRQAMLDLQKAKEGREAAAFGPLYSDPGSGGSPGSPAPQSWTGSPLDIGRQPWAQTPNHVEASPPSMGGIPGMAPSPSGSLQNGTNGPQPQTYPQMADAGIPDYGRPSSPPQSPQPGQPWHQPGTDLTSHFLAAKSQGFAPYDHPELGGTGQPGGSNPIANMDWSTFARMSAPQREGYKLFSDEKRKEREEQDRYGTGANGLYSTYDQAAFQMAPNDTNKQGQLKAQLQRLYPDGRVPKSAITTTAGGIHFDVTQGEKSSQFSDKRLTAMGDALDPSKQRAGAFGVSKQVYDRAERLESLASAFKDGNLDSRQVEELAIGLNAMLSGANTGAQQQVKSLVPNTIWGNAQKVKEWLVNEPQGLQQQAFVQRMLGSISREKATASDQIKRTQFQRIGRYADLEKSNPDGFSNTLQSAGIDPNEYHSWKKGGYKPISAVQTPEGGGQSGGKIRVSNGKETLLIDPSDAAAAARDGYQ